MEGMNIDALTELATEVLTSPDKSVRDRAAARLRFMSCYDNWETVKALLPLCQSNYLRFIVCKAMHFIVSNELGPQERKEMQMYVLDYLTMMRERGEGLPVYVRNELYSIYAAALYVNWRLMVVSLENESKKIGMNILDELSARFPTDDVLDCILEVLTYFARQESKGSLEPVRSVFVKEVLPTFFGFCVCQISSFGPRALEVCCTILEIAYMLPTVSIITVRSKTDDSIYLENGDGWFPVVTLAAQECGRIILTDPVGELSSQCARYLRMASSVLCLDTEWFQSRNTLSDLFLELSNSLLNLYKTTGFTHLMQLSCVLLVNIFDRDEGKVTAYLYNRPYIIELWAQVVRAVLDKWEDGEEELRQELTHLFFLFGDRVIPRATSMDVEDTRAISIATNVLQVAQCYFDNVVAKAHIGEDSNEIRTDTGVMLHNEKTLLPIAEMLFCEKIDIYTIIIQCLKKTIEQYEFCVSARETGNSEKIGELLLSLAVDVDSISTSLSVEDVPLFLMSVCLSRLSVIISAVAIAMLNDTARRNDELMGIIAQFAHELLCTDDSLTTAFLESLSLMDLDNDNSKALTGTDQRKKVHVGVLRALFFFCGCVYESLLESHDGFYDIMINLLYYVYIYHSDNACLTIDANLLLTKVLIQGARGRLLLSEKMTSILLAVKEERIEFLCVSSDELTPDMRKARSGMLSALTFFVETRYCASFLTLDLIPFIINRLLCADHIRRDPSSVLHDLVAITDGIHQPESFYWLLDDLTKHIHDFEELLHMFPDHSSLVLHLCAKLCCLATQLLQNGNKCEIRWGLVSFSFLSITGVMNSLGSSNCNWKEPIQIFLPGVVTEAVVYDVADIIHGMISGHWCNLGVALMYSDDFLSMFRNFLSLLLSVPAELIMARTIHREQVFYALLRAFLSTGSLGDQLYELMNHQFLWQPLLKYLIKCLHIFFLVDILSTINAALVASQGSFLQSSAFVDSEVIGDLFEEVVIHITICPSMERRALELCFNLLTKSFEWAQAACTTRMNVLLDFCSAYHRVRLRHILALLRSGKGDVLMSYMAVFGRGSRVQTLAAW